VQVRRVSSRLVHRLGGGVALERTIRETETERRNIHRKAWEWCAIADALHQRGMLQPERTGAGFAVGTEPLASAFAARGVSILATDLGTDEAGWINTNEHASSLDALFHVDS
jgi:hypothetical protein